MKKYICLGIFLGGLALTGCQNELYEDPATEHTVDQGVYIANEPVSQLFVEESKDIKVNDIIVKLTKKMDAETMVVVDVANQEYLDAYNKMNNTEYILLPSEMYELTKELKFQRKQTIQRVPLLLKNVQFSPKGAYALPIRLSSSNAGIIEGQKDVLLVLEQRINTKVLRINGSGSEDGNMFPNDFKVEQWTMEAMVNRSAYNLNNQSVCGTKLVSGSSALDEIYVRFGDVTINHNQLQIKTASSQIDIAADRFSAQPNEWYMLSFVYDGKKNYVYVNGELVAEREMRTGAYGLTGFWIGGANELIREIRFWKSARTQQQIKSYLWKMVDGNDDNLLLYYPLNGKKRDKDTNEITEDETKLWDWSNSAKHLEMPGRGRFDNNGGEGFTFPLSK